MRSLFIQLFIVIVVSQSIITFAKAQTPDEYYDRGVSKFKVGEYEAGISDFKKAIELNVRTALKAEAYANIGWYYNQLGDRGQAIQYCDKALTIDVMNISAYRCKANANLALGNRQEAMINYNKILVFDPKNIHAYSAIGQIQMDLGNYQEAMKYFDTAISIAPKGSVGADVMNAYGSRGILKLKLGQQSAGCQDLTKAWQLGFNKAYEFVKQFCPQSK